MFAVRARSASRNSVSRSVQPLAVCGSNEDLEKVFQQKTDGRSEDLEGGTRPETRRSPRDGRGGWR
eukprot:3473965-Rhodomonas_salina.1